MIRERYLCVCVFMCIYAHTQDIVFVRTLASDMRLEIVLLKNHYQTR